VVLPILGVSLLVSKNCSYEAFIIYRWPQLTMVQFTIFQLYNRVKEIPMGENLCLEFYFLIYLFQGLTM
jgi:hypothetical protein